jgi:hypothetical protein
MAAPPGMAETRTRISARTVAALGAVLAMTLTTGFSCGGAAHEGSVIPKVVKPAGGAAGGVGAGGAVCTATDSCPGQ